MSDPQSNGNGTGPRGRRGKRLLSPSEKYEIWLSLMRGEYTIAAAAERAGVDRSTIMKLRQVARQGALEALAASRPGVKAGSGPDPELAAARAEIAHRGSYEGVVWVSESTVRRVLARPPAPDPAAAPRRALGASAVPGLGQL